MWKRLVSGEAAPSEDVGVGVNLVRLVDAMTATAYSNTNVALSLGKEWAIQNGMDAIALREKLGLMPIGQGQIEIGFGTGSLATAAEANIYTYDKRAQELIKEGKWFVYKTAAEQSQVKSDLATALKDADDVLADERSLIIALKLYAAMN